MTRLFKKFIAHHSLFSESDNILLAVSGGVDSMVMADLFLKSGYTFSVAHCNFKLRNADSDADELLVKKWCETNQITFYSASFDTKLYAEKNHLSIQMAARELRYNFFHQLCKKQSLKYIATAHHADDFSETVFLKLLRNYGTAALQGIRTAEGNRVRPLLFASKKDIISYAKQHQIEWRNDISNFSDSYQRNKIRLNILPLLKEINPSISNNLLQQAEFANGDEKIIQHYLSEIRSRIVSVRGNDIVLSLAEIKNTASPLSVLHHLISSYGFRMLQTVSVFNSIENTESKKFYSETYCLTKTRNELVIQPKGQKELLFFEIPGHGMYEYDDKIITISPEEKTCSELFPLIKENSNTFQAWFDGNKISFPIIIRTKKDGDSFYPQGMKGRKKLSDYFIDQKYSSAEKESQWLMECAEEIFWVVGQRISETASVKPESADVLKITVCSK